jgi:D-inositol-3-phosphate glycosyltransferase
MMPKKKLLVWSDYVGVGTGFGTVSKYVLRSLQASGDYEISQLAINYHGEFFDQSEFPYQIVPAKLQDPKDPYGQQAFVETFASGKFDYVWIMNDTFVVEKVARSLPDIIQKMQAQNVKVPTIFYYYPVDCRVVSDATSMLELADVAIAYTEFGKQKTLEVLPHLEEKMEVIPHGTDTSVMRRLDEAERASLKFRLFKCSPDTFVWLNVNRNSQRKDIPRTIYAFKEFKKRVPKSRLYLHTVRDDVGFNLNLCLEELGLSDKTDVIFPDPRYSPKNPLPPDVLNMFYNASDAFVTTTLGEGWGLTHMDAMTQGMPVLCPENTVFPEQLQNGERGYMYECNNLTWVDNSGYRKQGLVDDIVEKMVQVYEETTKKENTKMLDAGTVYCQEITWDKVGSMWVDLLGNFKKKSIRQKLGDLL